MNKFKVGDCVYFGENRKQGIVHLIYDDKYEVVWDTGITEPLPLKLVFVLNESQLSL